MHCVGLLMLLLVPWGAVNTVSLLVQRALWLGIWVRLWGNHGTVWRELRGPTPLMDESCQRCRTLQLHTDWQDESVPPDCSGEKKREREREMQRVRVKK